ncbi:hypothetical protein JL720_1368 [Aureococcus anophagefferens]|nr:hypothetical protein JL720_1368 [Aureococcus anophagefferens]
MEAAGVTSKASAVLATGAPGYFKLTATNKVRQKLALQRSHGPCGDKGDPTALTLLRTSLSAPGADEGSGSATTARPRRPDVGASVEQQDLDLKVLTRMEQKLHFLRNPRYDAHNPNHQRRLTARPPSPRRIGRETYAETDPAAIARREALDRDGDGAEETQLRDVPLVIVEPREVAFSNHVVGGAYEQALSIKNASAISRRLRLLRPRTKFFTVASVKWPGARDSGNLAPGMSLRVLIRFEPDSLADYEDELRVVSEIGEVSVRLRATRDPPVLTLPDQLDDYPSPVAAQRYSDTMRLLPYYTVKPTSFDLGRDETTQIRVTFAPDGAPGEHRANFLLIGDDCRVVTHVLVGRAEAVEVTASDLDGVDLLADASYAPPNALGFESLPLGASATHEVSLLNRGELPLAFDWRAYKFAMRGAGRARLGAAPRCVALPCALGLGNVYELDEELCMMRLDATRVGSTDLALPCFVVDRRGGDPYESCRVVLNCETSGGRLRFAEPEVDLGLIAVGAKKEHVITFTNATSGDLEFSFAEVADAGLGGRHSGSQKSLGGRSSSKASDGRKSKSDASNGDGENPCENNEFKIDSPYCQLMFDPPVGTVGPRGEASVRVVCSAGKLPQRLRAHARVDVRSGRAAAEPQFMSLRGEVQAPKVYLTETDVDLGVVYVGVPVTRSLRLVNLSNLSRFKWERPGGASSTFDLGFSPPSDVLDAKQVCDVTMTFCALSAGVVDEVLGCRIFGMSLPLGFTLKAISKAAVLAYELLPDGAEPPPALADAALPQLPEGVSVPSQPPPPKLDFGAGVPLFERKTVRLAIRNLSAIAAKFSIAPKKYPVARPAPGGGVGASGGAARPPQAHPGRLAGEDEHVHERRRPGAQREAPRGRGGLGGARRGQRRRVLRVAAAGVLVPWGVLVVTVTAYNNMAGLFTDALECDVESVPASRLPIRLSVRGCPLTLRPECAGLDLITSPERPILNFGQMCVGSPQALAKHVRVRNSGPVDALLTWRVVPGRRRARGPRRRRRRELKVPAHGDGAFVVRLRPDTVAPGSRHLEDAGPSGTVRAMMVADALWVSRPKTPGASADLDNEADGPKVENRLAGLSLTTLSTVGRASGILKKANDPRVLQALKVVLDTKLLKYDYDGELIVRFSTGQEQRVALQGTVVRPALVASPPAHDFKVVRTDGSSCLSLFLSNPTEVDINGAALTWKPGGGDHDEAVTSLDAALRAEARANPRVPLPVTVTFKPKRDVKYCSRFRFDVHKGEPVDIVLQGVGSYEENVLPLTVRVAGNA